MDNPIETLKHLARNKKDDGLNLKIKRPYQPLDLREIKFKNAPKERVEKIKTV